MTSLLIYKEKLKAFYGKHDGVIVPLIKFILVFLAALELNIQLGYMDVLNNPFIPVIVGLVCCMLPYFSRIYAPSCGKHIDGDGSCYGVNYPCHWCALLWISTRR